jgi:hypothetical protein
MRGVSVPLNQWIQLNFIIRNHAPFDSHLIKWPICLKPSEISEERCKMRNNIDYVSAKILTKINDRIEELPMAMKIQSSSRGTRDCSMNG